MALFKKKRERERDYNPKYCQGGARDFKHLLGDAIQPIVVRNFYFL